MRYLRCSNCQFKLFAQEADVKIITWFSKTSILPFGNFTKITVTIDKKMMLFSKSLATAHQPAYQVIFSRQLRYLSTLFPDNQQQSRQ
jgi:hypothetical protein